MCKISIKCWSCKYAFTYITFDQCIYIHTQIHTCMSLAVYVCVRISVSVYSVWRLWHVLCCDYTLTHIHIYIHTIHTYIYEWICAYVYVYATWVSLKYPWFGKQDEMQVERLIVVIPGHRIITISVSASQNSCCNKLVALYHTIYRYNEPTATTTYQV